MAEIDIKVHSTTVSDMNTRNNQRIAGSVRIEVSTQTEVFVKVQVVWPELMCTFMVQRTSTRVIPQRPTIKQDTDSDIQQTAMFAAGKKMLVHGYTRKDTCVSEDREIDTGKLSEIYRWICKQKAPANYNFAGKMIQYKDR